MHGSITLLLSLRWTPARSAFSRYHGTLKAPERVGAQCDTACIGSSLIEYQVTAFDDHGRPSVLMRAAWQAASSSLCASILAQTVGAQVEEGSAAALQGLEVPAWLAVPIVAHLLCNLHPAALDVTSCTCHAHCAWLSQEAAILPETWPSI